MIYFNSKNQLFKGYLFVAYALPKEFRNQKNRTMLQELSKITQEEKIKNEKALKQFQFCMLSQNLIELEDLLDDKGLFFRKMNKTRAISFLYNLLNGDQKTTKIHWVEVKYGYSFDSSPGEHVMEIRYMEADPFTMPDLDNYKFGEPHRKSFNEFILRFAFQFKEGRISSIRFPKKVIESLSQFELCN